MSQEIQEPLLWRLISAALISVLMVVAIVLAGVEILWEVAMEVIGK